MSADCCALDDARIERDPAKTRLIDIHEIRAAAIAGALLAAGLVAGFFDAELASVVAYSGVIRA